MTAVCICLLRTVAVSLHTVWYRHIRVVCGNLLSDSACHERMSAMDSHRERRQDLEHPKTRNYGVCCINTYTCSKHVMPRFYPSLSDIL